MANTLQSNADYKAASDRVKNKMLSWYSDTMPSGLSLETELCERLRKCIDWTTKMRISEITAYSTINNRRVKTRCAYETVDGFGLPTGIYIFARLFNNSATSPIFCARTIQFAKRIGTGGHQ